MSLDILRTEVLTDPLVVGYAVMNNLAVAVFLNDGATGRTLNVNTLQAIQIYETIDTTEFDALTAAQQVMIDRILGLSGDILVGPSSKARAVLVGAFSAGTNTRASLLNEVKRDVSRAEELGLGVIGEADVWDARN